MELTLTYAQRINVHAILGAQRGPTLDDTRAFWRIQDMIGLSDEEKRQIDYKIVVAGEAFAPQWDPAKSASAAPRGFEFTSDELARVERAVKEWQPGFFAGMDRAWLEPLLQKFDALRSSADEPQERKLKRAK